MQYNKLQLAGNLTKDPSFVEGKTDVVICKFGLAVNRKYKGKESVIFIDCVAFGTNAEFIQKNFKKGSNVFIEGRLDFQTWEDDNQQKRSKHSMIVDHASFTGPKGAATTDEEEPKY